MRHLSILLVLWLAAACGRDSSGNAPVTGSTAFEGAIAELETFRTRMCACPDRACTEVVYAELKAWRLGLMLKLVHEIRTKAQDDRGNALDAEIRTCRKQRAGAATGSGSAGSGSAGSGSAGTGSAAPDHFEIALAELERFRVRMCSCTDRSCSQQVQLELKAWKRNLQSSAAERPTRAQDDRGDAIDKELKRCRKQAEAATPPTATDKLEAALSDMAELRNRMCACPNKTCGARVDRDMAAWATRTATELASIKSSPAEEARAEEIQSSLVACKHALP